MFRTHIDAQLTAAAEDGDKGSLVKSTACRSETREREREREGDGQTDRRTVAPVCWRVDVNVLKDTLRFIGRRLASLHTYRPTTSDLLLPCTRSHTFRFTIDAQTPPVRSMV